MRRLVYGWPNRFDRWVLLPLADVFACGLWAAAGAALRWRTR